MFLPSSNMAFPLFINGENFQIRVVVKASRSAGSTNTPHPPLRDPHHYKDKDGRDPEEDNHTEEPDMEAH
jgi:hypothetical protein